MSNYFPVHLPSNVHDYPTNQPNKFRVRLAKPLMFSGNWVCGLHSISYPYSWASTIGTLDEQWINVHFNYDGKERTLRVPVPKGSHTKISELKEFIAETLVFQSKNIKMKDGSFLKVPSFESRTKRSLNDAAQNEIPPKVIKGNEDEEEEEEELSADAEMTEETEEERKERSLNPKVKLRKMKGGDFDCYKKGRKYVCVRRAPKEEAQASALAAPLLNDPYEVMGLGRRKKVEEPAKEIDEPVAVEEKPKEEEKPAPKEEKKPWLNDPYEVMGYGKSKKVEEKPVVEQIDEQVTKKEEKKPAEKISSSAISSSSASMDAMGLAKKKKVVEEEIVEQPAKTPNPIVTEEKPKIEEKPKVEEKPKIEEKSKVAEKPKPEEKKTSSLSMDAMGLGRKAVEGTPVRDIYDSMGLTKTIPDKLKIEYPSMIDLMYGGSARGSISPTVISALISSIKIEYDDSFDRFQAFFSDKRITHLSFSEQLGYVLGWENRHNVHNGERAKYGCDLRGGFSSFAVYVNGLCEPMIIGNSFSALLRVVSISGAIPGEYNEKIYDSPIFARVLPRDVSEIEVELRTLDGRLVPFAYGTVMVVLVFKKVMNF